MTDTIQKTDVSPFQAAYWKSKYEKEKFLNTSVVSLINKFGSSLDLKILQKELLLTLMGQYLTGDSCYYTVERGREDVICTLSYGKVKCLHLPSIKRDAQLLSYLEEHPYPVHCDELPGELFDNRAVSVLSEHYAVLSPLRLKSSIIGLVFLGRKISRKNYSESDYALLHQFCTLAAMTFNHAILFQNAKLSIEELHKLNDARTDVINRITHEFRTPLTIIKAGLSSLKLDDKKVDVALWINHSITRLEHLIISLLDLNENYYDDTITHNSGWDPVNIIHEILPLHSAVASQKDISIQIKGVHKDIFSKLNISLDRFRQVVNNLIENAIKYSNNTSTIVIEFEEEIRNPDESTDGICLPDWKDQFAKNIAQYRNIASITEKSHANEDIRINPQKISACDDNANQQFVVMKITDGGIGIPSEDIELLSQPFAQASNSPDSGIKGKGLGLTVTQKILSSYGGKIFCRSKEGEGTTFTVFLALK